MVFGGQWMVFGDKKVLLKNCHYPPTTIHQPQQN
jgi:hypothetical protein